MDEPYLWGGSSTKAPGSYTIAKRSRHPAFHTSTVSDRALETIVRAMKEILIRS